MRYIAVLLIAFTISTVCKSQPSPNTPDPNAASAVKTAPANTPNTVPAPAPAVQTPPQAQTHLITGDAIRIARAELQRDNAIEAMEAYKQNVYSMWTALGVIVAIIVVFGIYIAFKDRKEYEVALQQVQAAKDDAKEASKEAKSACKEAREWEKQAAGSLAEIGKRTEEELNKIRTQAKEALDEIERRGEAKIKDLIAKAEQERLISELCDQSFRANTKQEYEEARRKYAQTLKRTSDVYEVQSYWCAILANWARRNKDDKLFKEAHDVYDKLKALASEHKGKSEIQTAQIGAGVALANFYIQAGKMLDAKVLLDEVEPLFKEVPEGEGRQSIVDFSKELRQEIGKK